MACASDGCTAGFDGLKMKDQKSDADASREESRRKFLASGLCGMSLFGMGGALGVLAPEARGQSGRPSGRKLGAEFTYDVSGLAKIDPKLIQYELVAKLTPGFKSIEGMAVDAEDRIWVAGVGTVKGFDKSGALERELSVAGKVNCLEAGPDHRFYAGYEDHVEVLGAEGKVEARWESPAPKAVLTSISAGAKDVFVADAGNRVVWRYDLAGKLTGAIGKKEAGKTKHRFVVPSPFFDVRCGRDGLIWVANPGEHLVEAFTMDGERKTGWGETSTAVQGFCGCCNPVHFAFLPDGRFVTAEKGIPRVKIHSSDGRFDCVVAGPETFTRHFNNPGAKMAGLGVAADSQGRVVVGDPLTGEVSIFIHKSKKA
jgi:hypothetical protein